MLRRGFKAEANWLARDVRRSLGIEAQAPLPPTMLAEHLGVAVLPLSALAAEGPPTLAHFLGRAERDAFSGLTIHAGSDRLIVHNDSHRPGRQAANIAHELAHLLLHHPPHGLLGTDGERRFEATIEEEANWLGPALLISEEAALWIAEQGLSVPEAARLFGVSSAVVQFRTSAIGAHKRVAARRSKAA